MVFTLGNYRGGVSSPIGDSMEEKVPKWAKFGGEISNFGFFRCFKPNMPPKAILNDLMAVSCYFGPIYG